MDVLAINAFAAIRADAPVLMALAVVFETVGPSAVASLFIVVRLTLCLFHFLAFEDFGVGYLKLVDSLWPHLAMVMIFTSAAVATVTSDASSETLAVQLETL